MSAHWYHLSDAVSFKVSGKDARRYLNNRLSNDLRSLAQGESTLAAALTAQGRVECLCSVFVGAQDVFYLVADGGNRQAIFASLGRFIVADRVSIEDISAVSLFAHITASTDAVSHALGDAGEACFMRPCNRIGAEGVDVLLVNPQGTAASERLQLAFGAPLSRDEYTLLRCSQGSPVFPDEVNDRVILTECGMRSAVSFSKGCYVGQEVIERSDAIGKLPRTLVRMRFAGVGNLPAETSIVSSAGESLGKVVTAAPDTSAARIYVFALLKSGSYSIGSTVSAGGFSGEILSMEQHTK
jgi:folate-binding protein YgfZ